MRIWKYPIVTTGRQWLTMPVGAKILAVQIQEGIVCLWAMVEPSSGDETVTIATYGTGCELPDNPGEYIGTYQDGPLVFHVFRMTD